MNEMISAIKSYIDAKIEYEVASAMSSHEVGLHDDEPYSCREERQSLEKAEKALAMQGLSELVKQAVRDYNLDPRLPIESLNVKT